MESSEEGICCIILGMAGSGKTSLVQRLSSESYQNKSGESSKDIPYIINLDPACANLPYPANIDIRDTVKYKEIMKQYGLGPNGGIMTSLNLFSTRFDQILKIIDKRIKDHKLVLIDTPGQIEVFTWSASGTIITDALASSYPTVIVYVMDIVKSINPVSFMSNMLYACSIMYKTKLPFILAMNKTDITDHEFAVKWMKDFESFQSALEEETSYTSNLSGSMSLLLDTFYSELDAVGISAIDGKGIGEFMEKIETSKIEYLTNFKPKYDKLKNKKNSEEDSKI